MPVLDNDVSDGSIHSQEYKSFEIDAVTIKKSMTEYHHWINHQAYGLHFFQGFISTPYQRQW